MHVTAVSHRGMVYVEGFGVQYVRVSLSAGSASSAGGVADAVRPALPR